jgi:hypothetical protein
MGTVGMGPMRWKKWEGGLQREERSRYCTIEILKSKG